MDYRREWPMAHHSSPNARHSMDRVNFPLMDRLMEILTPLDELELCWGKPLAELTTFRIGGPVTCVARPVGARAFGVLMAVVRRESIPHLILGGGSNVLAPDDPWDVLVVRMAAPAGRIERVNPETEAAGQEPPVRRTSKERFPAASVVDVGALVVGAGSGSDVALLVANNPDIQRIDAVIQKLQDRYRFEVIVLDNCSCTGHSDSRGRDCN
ncbi:MAG: hypothetical protein HGA63_07720 [Syntrophobacteraceae bacterium]|nr:hypothetical protein [Syntrophobacteraceae bacterium]